MPEQPDDFEPTEVDIDLVIEESTSKPIKPENLAVGITSTRQRIVQLEAEKTKLLDRMDTATQEIEGTLNCQLAEVDRDMATARERLAHYVSQIGRQN